MKLGSLFKRKKKEPKVAVKSKAPKKKTAAPKKKVSKAPKKKAKTASRKKRVVKEPVHINKNECPECGSLNVVISKITGNTICQECGAILAGLPPELEKQFVDAKKQG